MNQLCGWGVELHEGVLLYVARALKVRLARFGIRKCCAMLNTKKYGGEGAEGGRGDGERRRRRRRTRRSERRVKGARCTAVHIF